MKIVIASRIFEPEPSAASFRLAALARAFADRGHDVTVLTVKLPKSYFGDISSVDRSRGYRVSRFPVLRDREGYVRGYLQYLSFDIPLFFRLLFGRKADLVVVEPPPTTGFFARFATRLRRTPYVYYAADIWSDAAGQTGAPAFVVNAVRVVERWVWRGARAVLSVSAGVSDRLAKSEPRAKVVEVGNGVNVKRFQSTLGTRVTKPLFVYAGTASEWHGASVVLRAYAASAETTQNYSLAFVGGGSEMRSLQQLATELGIRSKVLFAPTLPAESLTPLLETAVAAVATLKPGSGYDFAFPTKLYSGAACGAPLIFAGPGPARDFVKTQVAGESLGWVCDWDAEALAEALNAAARSYSSDTERREVVRAWARENVSLEAVAEKAVGAIEAQHSSKEPL